MLLTRLAALPQQFRSPADTAVHIKLARQPRPDKFVTPLPAHTLLYDLVFDPNPKSAQPTRSLFGSLNFNYPPPVSDGDFIDSTCLSLEYDFMEAEPARKGGIGWYPISAEKFLRYATRCDFNAAWDYARHDRPDLVSIAVIMKYSVNSGGSRGSIEFIPTTTKLPIGCRYGFVRFELDASGVTVSKIWDRSTSQIQSADLFRALHKNKSIKVLKNAVARSHQEYVKAKIKLLDGKILPRRQVLFPFDLCSNPLFDGFSQYRIYSMMKFIAEPHGAIQMTSHGNPIILKQHYDAAQAQLINKMNQMARLQTSVTQAQRINTSATSYKADGHEPLKNEADAFDPEQNAMNTQLFDRLSGQLPKPQRDVMSLFHKGLSLTQIAHHLDLSYEDIDQIYDMAIEQLVRICG